jgi:two-component system phosphate regulon response regulator PhoB
VSTLLLVEDEADLADPLRFLLEARGLAVQIARTGAEALAAVRASAPDAVLLDLMLPDLSGIEVCRRLRSHPATAQVPILVVSARGEEYDKVVSFEAGADDYITKPYSARELVLRVMALLRRGGPATPRHGPLRSAGLVVDAEQHVASVDGEPVDLTVVEFRMLGTLLAQPGKALRREDICLGTWGSSYAISERSVDTNVKRLRGKLGAAGRHLETVRGAGYRWNPGDGEG